MLVAGVPVEVPPPTIGVGKRGAWSKCRSLEKECKEKVCSMAINTAKGKIKWKTRCLGSLPRPNEYPSAVINTSSTPADQSIISKKADSDDKNPAEEAPVRDKGIQ